MEAEKLEDQTELEEDKEELQEDKEESTEDTEELQEDKEELQEDKEELQEDTSNPDFGKMISLLESINTHLGALNGVSRETETDTSTEDIFEEENEDEIDELDLF